MYVCVCIILFLSYKIRVEGENRNFKIPQAAEKLSEGPACSEGEVKFSFKKVLKIFAFSQYITKSPPQQI